MIDERSWEDAVRAMSLAELLKIHSLVFAEIWTRRSALESLRLGPSARTRTPKKDPPEPVVP